MRQNVILELQRFNLYKNIFLEEFNNIINTSNGIKELRTLILHLAITGKLIDKYSNENSEELYNRIIKQREFLIETKKKGLHFP